MEMPDSNTGLWCYILGDKNPFILYAAPTIRLSVLKELIKGGATNILRGVDAKDLTLWRPRDAIPIIPSVTLAARIETLLSGVVSQFADELEEAYSVATVFQTPFPPVHNLHIIVTVPDGGPSLTLVREIGERVDNRDLLREYEDIFIEVDKWGAFQSSDIEMNGLRIFVDGTVLDFVTEFERELDARPGLASDAHGAFESIRNAEFQNAYFGPSMMMSIGPSEELIFEGESHRRAENVEVKHLAYIASHDWHQSWGSGNSLTEASMSGIFFYYFAFDAGGTVLANQSWPFKLITKCETALAEDQLRQYQPRSDLLVLKSTLPRLLVEVNSKPKKERPEDLVRMLLAGAAVVRFANKFVEKFKAAKNFVLFAIYIWDHGGVTRFTLFQEPNNREVRCKQATYSLNTTVGRAEFVRQLYNLRHVLETEEGTEDTEAKIQQLQNRIQKHNKQRPMKAFYTTQAQGNKRKRPNNDLDNRGAGGGTTECAELEAHGYELAPQDILDESGGVWTLFSHMPTNILTVYQRSDPSRKFIAKKVREESNELEIFKLLDTFQPKSEHIVALRESFQTQSTSWAILPEMSSVANIVSLAPKQLYGKVTAVCYGLIKGVGFLHKFCIAHRDIKPPNLVVDRHFCLKIIDFDVAIEVEDENEVVYGQCGTKNWMAPEMVEKSMCSPIKADRWSTGQVIYYLLDNLGEENTVLRATARMLTVHNPDQRSSMLQVATLFSDVVNVTVERKASRSLQDIVEVDEENGKPPEAKKQKLSVAN